MGDPQQRAVTVHGDQPVLVVQVGVPPVAGSSRWTVGVSPKIVVQSATGKPSPPTSTVGQAEASAVRCEVSGPAPGPGSGVASEEPVSPCMVAVPSGPAYGLCGGRGAYEVAACAGVALAKASRAAASSAKRMEGPVREG